MGASEIADCHVAHPVHDGTIRVMGRFDTTRLMGGYGRPIAGLRDQ
jgi:hypothetical protein